MSAHVKVTVSCDAYSYGLPTCLNSFDGSVLLNEVRTGIRKRVREYGWWQDTAGHHYYPRHLCPECREEMKQRAATARQTARAAIARAKGEVTQ